MIVLAQRMLEGTPPAWLRKVEARLICAVFAEAFGVKAPSMRGLRAGEALALLREFSDEQMRTALESGSAALCRERLGERAHALGARLRRAAPLGREGRAQLVRYLYRGIEIDLTGTMPGGLRFGPCSFAQVYAPACCALMSAFDEGFICGLLGLEGPLVFETRITEGAACCRACIS